MTNSQTPKVVRDCSMDWVKFDAHVARDGSLSMRAKALYAALATYADATGRYTDPDLTGMDIPTRSSLAACLGVSVDTIDRATKELEDYQFPSGAQLLEVERRKDPRNPKSNLPSVYRLLDSEYWDERGAERVKQRKARGGRTDAARGGRTDAARGGRTDAARGGRTDAARGGRTDAAVPIPPRGFQEHTQEDLENGVCVDESFDSTGATDQVLQTVALEVRPLLSQADRGQVDAVVRDCLQAGHSISAITKRVAGRTNANTCAPCAVLVKALRQLQSEPPAASHTSGTPGASHVSVGASGRPQQVSCPDCGQSISRVGATCLACASEALAAGGAR